MRNLKVFVYGTLREGRGNHPILGPNRKKIADATVNARLYMTGGLPFMTKSDDPADRVVGEVYELEDTDRLADLDMLEGHPHWYAREEIDATPLDGTPSLLGWAYFMSKHDADTYLGRRVVSGDFLNPVFEEAVA